MLATLTSIDYGVIAFYMLAMVGLGFYFANEQRTTQDFFLGGRSFSWFPLGMSLMATLISALSYTGLPGQAYEYGVRCLILPLSVWMALPIMVGVVLPIFRGLSLYSLYEYLELRFDSRTRLAGSLIFVVWRMLWLGGVIYAPCKVLVIASGTDIPEWVLITILGAVTTFYTFLGGMKAVVWTDVIQGMAMLGGIVVVILGVWWQTSGGHEHVTEVASGLGRLQPASFALDLGSAWYLWGALPHWFLANLSFYAADQITAQRFLSAKSVDAARTSYLVNCIVLTLLQPGLIYIGLCMLAFYQDHPQDMQANWVASLDNKTREVVKDDKSWPLLDPKHHPEQEISVETIDQLVKEKRILKPNTREPFEKSDELVDRDTGKVLIEKLMIRRPPNEREMSEVVVRKGAPEEMLPRFIADHLPWGAAGLIVAALLAACMSSIDSGLNSICTLLVMDFHRRYGIGRAWLAKKLGKTPETLNESDELKLAQPLTLAVGVGATLFAIGVAQVRDIFEIMVAIANTFGAPLLAVFLLGMLTRRCTGRGAFFGLITGSMLTVGITVLSLLKKYGYVAPGVWPFHDIWTVTFGVLFTLVAGYGASLVLGKPKTKTELRGLVWGVGHLGVLAADEETPILGEIDPDARAMEMNRLWTATREFIAQPLREAREEQLRHLASEEAGQLDSQTIIMLVSVAVMLTLQYYYVTSGSSPIESPIREWLESCFALVPATRYDDRGELSRLGYWSIGNFVLYVAIPATIVLGIFRQPLSQFGLKLRGWNQNWWVYVAFYLLLFPAVVLASQWQSFQARYPFYHVYHEFPGPRFYVWELLYAVQFVSLEFFFRGYMIQAGRKRLGPYVIFVMTIPYCMIHFGKPVQETLGAILAGILLGFMALKTRSIWLGAALHIAVAWTMDALAVWRK